MHFMDDRFMNLIRKEVILTLLWQSGSSESATVCFVFSLSICHWLFKCGVLRVVCVCVCTCVTEMERGGGGHSTKSRTQTWFCAVQRGRHGHTTAASVQTHMNFITVSVTRLCSPLMHELMVKLRTLLKVFTFILKAKVRDYGKGCVALHFRLVIVVLS